MEAFANGYSLNTASPNEAMTNRPSQMNHAPTLKVQDLLRNANNKSNGGHMDVSQVNPGSPMEDSQFADMMSMYSN